MATRIDRRFAELKTAGRAALVTFLTAGDPDPGRTERLVAWGKTVLVDLTYSMKSPAAPPPRRVSRCLSGGIGALLRRPSPKERFIQQSDDPGNDGCIR